MVSLASSLAPQELSSALFPRILKPIKQFLAVQNDNVQFVALSCLHKLPSEFWAGSSSSSANEDLLGVAGEGSSDNDNVEEEVFGEQEVKYLMRNLDSTDAGIRKLVKMLLFV
jgi:hypothetical protein